MAREQDEPLDFDPEDPEDTAAENYDASANVQAEKGATPKQKATQELAAKLDKDPALMRAYQLAQHPAASDFDFTDPKNLEALRVAAEDVKKGDPAELLKAALDQHLYKLPPDKQKELAQHFLSRVDTGGQAAQEGSTGIDLGGMTGGQAPAESEGAAAVGDGAAPAAQPGGLQLSGRDLTPTGSLEAKSELGQAEAGYKLQGAEAHQAQQAIIDEVELGKQEQLAGVANDYKQKLTEINEKYQTQMDGQLAHYRQAVDELRAFSPEVYTQTSTGWNVGAALAIGLNQMGVAMAGNNAPNQAMGMIRDSVNRRMEDAKMALETKRGGVMREGQLLERMREVWGDEKTAFAATKAAMWDDIKSQAERDLAGKSPELRGLQAKETIAKISAEQAHAMQGLVDTATQLQQQRRLAEIHEQNSEANKAVKLINAQNRVDVKAASDEGKAVTEFYDKMEGGGRGTPDHVKKALEVTRLVGNAEGIAKKFGEPTKENLDKLTGTQVALLVSEVSKIAKGGSATEGEMHMLLPAGFQQRLAKFASESANKPIGAKAGAYVKDYLDYLKTLREDNQALVDEHRKSVSTGYLGRIKNVDTRKAIIGRYPAMQDIFFPPEPKETAANP